MNRFPRLTLQKAEALAIRELGTARGLKRITETPSDVYMYKMQLGSLQIRLDNGWFAHNGLFKLLISTSFSNQVIVKYFDPKTLEEDSSALDAEQSERFREQFNELVCGLGIEGCRKIIEAAVQR